MQILVHLIILPRVFARNLGVSLDDLLKPMLVPFFVAVCTAIAGVIVKQSMEDHSIIPRVLAVLMLVCLGLSAGLIHTKRFATAALKT